MNEKATTQIERSIREIKLHHREAPYRILAYYHDPEVSEFDTSPSDQQFQQAAAYLEYAISELGVQDRDWEWSESDRSAASRSRRRWTRSRLEDMIYGITMELVVSAVHLNLKSREYLSNLSQTGRTPRVRESVNCLVEDLSEDLDDDQIEEIKLVLRLAKVKRDNLVHFGFHSHGAHYFPQLFINVCGFLIQRYADTDDIPELRTMAEYLEDYHRRRSEAELYPEVSVGFEPFG